MAFVARSKTANAADATVLKTPVTINFLASRTVLWPLDLPNIANSIRSGVHRERAGGPPPGEDARTAGRTGGRANEIYIFSVSAGNRIDDGREARSPAWGPNTTDVKLPAPVIVGKSYKHCKDDPHCFNRYHYEIKPAAHVNPGQLFVLETRDVLDSDLTFDFEAAGRCGR